jgi:hypothetical protein
MNPDQWNQLTKTVDLFEELEIQTGDIHSPSLSMVYSQTGNGFTLEVAHLEPEAAA